MPLSGHIFCRMKTPHSSFRPASPLLSLAAIVAIALLARDASAQCPDGTPAPCKSASSLARRANPPLNERAWIVVPFGNVTKSPELDWLRDASVNLLALDLSRWTDIHVVDDKRVGDLLRELPAARTAQSLTLSDGLTLARRAGAGRLVMGDFFKVGMGARLVANVFSVRDGAKLRSITQQAPVQDSLISAFGPLARGVLAVPPPPDAKLGATGTTSVDAYQEYLLGVTALNRFELTDARQHLLKALSIDSTFALAHYKLSVALHWGAARGDTNERSHAVAAARLGGALPPRERALISGRVAFASGDYVRACVTLGTLVAKDSADVEALYGIGECQYHAGYTEPEVIDSTHARFRGNWNVAIAAFRRVLLLDPTYHPAFEHILDALTAGQVVICRVQGPVCGNDDNSWQARIIRDGDSLVIQPMSHARLTEVFRQQRTADANRSALLNLRAAQKIAQDWVDAGPGEARARLNLGYVDLLLGDVQQASDELRQIRSRTDQYTRLAALQYRVHVAVLLGHGAEGRAVLDSLRRETPDEAESIHVLASYYTPFGKLERTAAAIQGMATVERWSPERLRYMQHYSRVLLGLPPDQVAADERRYWESLTGDTLCAAGLPTCRTSQLLLSLAYALRVPRMWWPFRVRPAGLRYGPAYMIATGDTATLRKWIPYLDSISQARVRSGANEQAMSVIAADAALALRDSTAALRTTRFFVDSVMPKLVNLDLGVELGSGAWPLMLAPRMMLQRADLAAALGFPDEARTWYARVLDLWAEADPELSPTVARVRAAMAGLGANKR